MLKKIHLRICGEHIPWWRKSPDDQPADAARTDDSLDADSYKAGRKNYIKEGKGTPPPGAEL